MIFAIYGSVTTIIIILFIARPGVVARILVVAASAMGLGIVQIAGLVSRVAIVPTSVVPIVRIARGTAVALKLTAFTIGVIIPVTLLA